MPLSLSPWGPWWLAIGPLPGPWTPWDAAGPFRNLSFEDAGSSGGLADAWDLESQGGWTVADYDGSAVEDFEAWSDFLSEFSAGTLIRALYHQATGAVPLENFETGWANNQYLFELAATVQVMYGGQNVEGYEAGWLNDAPIGMPLDDPGFDIGPHLTGSPQEEAFEVGWGDDAPVGLPLDDPGFDISPLVGSPAAYRTPSGTELAEGFEHVRFDKQIEAVDPASDTLTITGHGFANGELVTLVNEDGALPTGLFPRTDHFVINSATNTFKLSRAVAGAAVDITDMGSGRSWVRSDPAKFWTGRELVL